MLNSSKRQLCNHRASFVATTWWSSQHLPSFLSKSHLFYDYLIHDVTISCDRSPINLVSCSYFQPQEPKVKPPIHPLSCFSFILVYDRQFLKHLKPSSSSNTYALDSITSATRNRNRIKARLRVTYKIQKFQAVAFGKNQKPIPNSWFWSEAFLISVMLVSHNNFKKTTQIHWERTEFLAHVQSDIIPRAKNIKLTVKSTVIYLSSN